MHCPDETTGNQQNSQLDYPAYGYKSSEKEIDPQTNCK
jgi:hypothetical protein